MSANIAVPKVSKATVVKKAAPAHPTYSAMIKKAITELKEKGGSSKAAILKYLTAHYKLGTNVTQINAHLRMALKRGVAKADLKQVKGNGASGSFRLGEKKVSKPSVNKTVKKPVAKKASDAKPKSPKKKATKTLKSKAEKKAKSPKKAAKKTIKKAPKVKKTAIKA